MGGSPRRTSSLAPLEPIIGHIQRRPIHFVCILVVMLFVILRLTTKTPRVEFSNCVQTMSDKTLYQQIKAVFPYRTQEPIPKSVWRSWKTKELDSDRMKITNTWKNIAPDWKLHLYDDNDMDEWVKEKYYKIPQILAAWYLMPKVILRSDFFRYLVLLAHGGIWADMDVTLKVKPEDWIPSGLYTDWKDIGGVVANEQDQPTGKMLAQRRFQIAQYCMMFKSGHPALVNIVSNVVVQTMNRAEAGLLGDVNQRDIEQWTGPGPYTDEIFWYWNRRGPGGISVQDLKEDATWNAGYGAFSGKNVTGFVETMRVGDLILLHKKRFNNIDTKDSYIVHHTTGTWRDDIKED
ncbi:mannosyltransferase Och1p [Planoprotostelium fungivorum]|uniref:Mannosyltransferase Och1p n=1 Tax=Planoprotostelium fungivorum TaxID=1890364 RepID=A0A2P6MZR8_9EUKA|nr:mannosyltransferase Och1p [Planoprotostelium fungivorum]